MGTLFTPWRYAYITQPPTAGQGCFFCQGASAPDDPERLVVHVARHHLVMLNRHPYTNGHLMVAPLAHVASPAACGAEARAEFWSTVLLAQRVLEMAYQPNGMNMGMNLGRSAGAGVPDHFHFHLVPRWHGDTNFMTAIGDLRLVPEDLGGTWERLRPLFVREVG